MVPKAKINERINMEIMGLNMYYNNTSCHLPNVSSSAATLVLFKSLMKAVHFPQLQCHWHLPRHVKCWKGCAILELSRVMWLVLGPWGIFCKSTRRVCTASLNECGYLFTSNSCIISSSLRFLLNLSRTHCSGAVVLDGFATMAGAGGANVRFQ